MNHSNALPLKDDIHFSANYTNKCLVAAPSMEDPFFSKSVVYIAQHDHYGAMGFVINQASDMDIHHLFSQLDIKSNMKELPVLNGGPMQPEVGFVLHTGQPFWASSFLIKDQFCITTSKDILQAIAHNEGITKYEMLLGYAGWIPGQLEAEVARGDWFSCDAEPFLLFDAPYQDRWDIAIEKVGIKQDWLSEEVGHA